MQCKAYCYATTGKFKFHNVKAQQRRVALWQAKIPVGTRVKVYKNIHEDCYSIQDAKTDIVIGYCSSIVLTDPTFRVGEAGREKVVQTGQYAKWMSQLSSRQRLPCLTHQVSR